jgi:hypothetical protein
MAEWSKDHVVAMGSLKLRNFGLVVKTWLKVETGRGQLGGLVEPSKWKGGESAVAILRFSMW